MSAHRHMTENQFFARLFAGVAVGLLWVLFNSDAFVAVLIRLWLVETFL